MKKIPQDILNSIVAVVFLVSAIISLPNIFLATLIMGVVIGEGTIGLILAGSLIALNILAFYYIVKSIVKKSVIYTKKGQKINVKVYIFIAVIANLIVFIIASGVAGMVLIPWLISVIASLIVGFAYQGYKE